MTDNPNPFELTLVNPGEVKIIPPSAVEAIQRAEVDIQISTAKRYPMHDAKRLPSVKLEMTSFATLDQETAESCFYSLPRGGKNIQGPSVRLAEIALACYGNLRVATRIVETIADGDNPHVVVQAVCHDLEKNVAVCIEKRRRITKKKNRPAPDEDDINLAANAGSAIALRDAIFKVIPGALIKPVYESAKQVAIGDVKSLSDRRARAVDRFGKMGVSPDRILALLAKSSIEEVNLADLETLLGLHTAIKEGQATIDEAFPQLPSKPSFSGESKRTEALPPKATSREGLTNLMKSSQVSEGALLAYLKDQNGEEYSSLDAIDEQLAKHLVDSWPEIVGSITGGVK